MSEYWSNATASNATPSEIIADIERVFKEIWAAPYKVKPQLEIVSPEEWLRRRAHQIIDIRSNR